jgi:hypothetical protein
MGWETNITASQFKGKLPLQSFNQLQAAWKERASVSGVTIPTMFNSDMSKYSSLPSNWFSSFQSGITTMIPLFVNHTDHSGNWNGQTTIPNWTEATILTAIGDASRIAVPSSLVCAKWCYQQYKILNMLRWTTDYDNRIVGNEIYWSPTWGVYISSIRRTKHGTFSGSFSDMKLFLSGLSYGDWEDNVPINEFAGYYSDTEHCGIRWEATLWTCPFNHNKAMTQEKSAYKKSESYPKNNYSCDIYKATSASGYTGWRYAPHTNATERHTKILVGNMTESDLTLNDIYYPSSTILPIDGLLEPPQTGNLCYELRIGDSTIVIKFDGTNGFQYRGTDW